MRHAHLGRWAGSSCPVWPVPRRPGPGGGTQHGAGRWVWWPYWLFKPYPHQVAPRGCDDVPQAVCEVNEAPKNPTALHYAPTLLLCLVEGRRACREECKGAMRCRRASRL